MHDCKEALPIHYFEKDDQGVAYAPSTMAVACGGKTTLGEAVQHLNAIDDAVAVLNDEANEIIRALDGTVPSVRPASDAQGVTRLNIGNAYTCNMGCSYCYNELPTKKLKGSQASGGMSLSVGRQMIDSLISQSGDEQLLSLVFIGGEPLLQKTNLYTLVDYAYAQGEKEGKQFNIAVYTNGTLMDQKVVSWANEKQVSLVVSLDGPPRQNDKFRKYLGGRSTSPKLLANVEYLVEHSISPWRRVRAVCAQESELLLLHKYLFALGFNEIHFQAAYDENGMGDRKNIPDIEELANWYGDILLEGKIISISPFDQILQRLAHRGASITSWYPCTAGRSALGVHQNGDIYACHHFFEEDKGLLGNVKNGLPPPSRRQKYMKSVTEREPCNSCWAKHLCGGECYHRAHTTGQGYFGVIEDVCNSRKKTIELGIQLFARVATQRPEALRALVMGEYFTPNPMKEAYACDDLDEFSRLVTNR